MLERRRVQAGIGRTRPHQLCHTAGHHKVGGTGLNLTASTADADARDAHRRSDHACHAALHDAVAAVSLLHLLHQSQRRFGHQLRPEPRQR
jgi:hypothetical protein